MNTQIKLWHALLLTLVVSTIAVWGAGLAGENQSLKDELEKNGVEVGFSSSEAAPLKLPDLKMNIPTSWPKTADLFSTVNLPFTVCNIGQGSVITDYVDVLYTSGSTYSYGNPTQLSPGQCYTQNASVNMETNCNLFSTATASDANNNVSESNEGNNGYNQPSSAYVKANPAGNPGTPWFTNNGGSSVTVNWNNVKSESGYYLYRCLGSTCTNKQYIGSVNYDTTSYTDYSVVGKSTYRYWVEAVGCPNLLGSPASVKVNP